MRPTLIIVAILLYGCSDRSVNFEPGVPEKNELKLNDFYRFNLGDSWKYEIQKSVGVLACQGSLIKMVKTESITDDSTGISFFVKDTLLSSISEYCYKYLDTVGHIERFTLKGGAIEAVDSGSLQEMNFFPPRVTRMDSLIVLIQPNGTDTIYKDSVVNQEIVNGKPKNVATLNVEPRYFIVWSTTHCKYAQNIGLIRKIFATGQSGVSINSVLVELKEFLGDGLTW